MKKEEIIERYGEAEYTRRLEQQREYNKEHREEQKAYSKRYREAHLEETKAAVKKYHDENPEKIKSRKKKYLDENPEKIKANNREVNRKGGKRYAKHLKYEHTGLRGDRNAIRKKHARQYKPYKQIIAPDSQLHHEWIPRTAKYRGVALVEADAHMHGFVDVIEILAGRITLRTEEEIKRGGKKK